MTALNFKNISLAAVFSTLSACATITPTPPEPLTPKESSKITEQSLRDFYAQSDKTKTTPRDCINFQEARLSHEYELIAIAIAPSQHQDTEGGEETKIKHTFNKTNLIDACNDTTSGETPLTHIYSMVISKDGQTATANTTISFPNRNYRLDCTDIFYNAIPDYKVRKSYCDIIPQ